MRKYFIIILTICSLSTLFTSCGTARNSENNYSSSQNNFAKSSVTIQSNISPEVFLGKYNLAVKGNPVKFNVNIPASWDVNSGDYPEGLYWRLANEFSKDVGLDLTPYKGTSAEVWRYDLYDGLPAQGEQSNFMYPSYAILLVHNQKVIGAWLAFNRSCIGPSVKKTLYKRHYRAYL